MVMLKTNRQTKKLKLNLLGTVTRALDLVLLLMSSGTLNEWLDVVTNFS